MGERLPCKQEASGSIPLISTRAAEAAGISTLKTEEGKKATKRETFLRMIRKVFLFKRVTSERTETILKVKVATIIRS